MQKDIFRKLRTCYQIAEDKKCRNLKIFDVRETSGITDYVVVATCTSEPHLRAVGDNLSVIFKEKLAQVCRIDYSPLSGWLVLDSFDVIVHAMTEPVRREYAFDDLFVRANTIDFEKIFSVDICGKTAVCAG